jgi:hypothetical protein
MTVSWENFDGTRFQLLCNALLIAEVSKNAQVFSGSGPDGGIDALFSGKYGENEGSWRFQDKFHNSGNKTNDLNSFKHDIKRDIGANFHGENFIVYLTNLEFSPKKKATLIEYVQKEISSLEKGDCEVMIWNHGHIQALLTAHPIIHQGFWDVGNRVLKSVQDYFKAQLRPQADDTHYQLINHFFGRSKEILEIDEFLKSASQTSLAIVASGGLGKTRLIVHYCLKHLGQQDIWHPVVLVPSDFSVSRLEYLMLSKNRLLVIIDDAHRHPKVTAEVKQVMEGQQWHKLIITTRNTLFDRLRTSIPLIVRNLTRITLLPLTYQERKELLAAELPNQSDSNIAYIATHSAGIPILLLEMIRIIRSGSTPMMVVNEEMFKDNVLQYFDEAANEIVEKTGITKKQLNDFLVMLAAFRPILWNSNNTDILCELLSMDYHSLEQLKNEWLKTNLVIELQNSIDIKPDSYADAIICDLVKRNPSLVDYWRKHPKALGFQNQLLINLTSIESNDSIFRDYVDHIVGKYMDQINTYENVADAFDLIMFGLKLSYHKPDICFRAIKFYLGKVKAEASNGSKWIDDMCEPAFRGLNQKAVSGSFSNHDVFEYVVEFSVLRDRFNFCQEFYQYADIDFYTKELPGQWGIRQKLILENLLIALKSANKNLRKAGVCIATGILDFDLAHTHRYEEEAGQVIYVTGDVPCVYLISEVRRTLIDVLFERLSVEEDEEVLKLLQSQLLDLLFYAFAGFRTRAKNYYSHFKAETLANFKLWEQVLQNNPGFSLKEEVLGKIARFEFGGVPEVFAEAVDRVKLAATHSTLFDKLKSLVLHWDYHYVSRYFEKDCQQLIADYASVRNLLADMSALASDHTIDKKESNFTNVFRCLKKIHPESSAEIDAVAGAYG